MNEIETLRREVQQLTQVVMGHRLDRQQLAERLRIDPHTVSRWARSGRLPAPVGGYWTLAAIAEWERSQAAGNV